MVIVNSISEMTTTFNILQIAEASSWNTAHLNQIVRSFEKRNAGAIDRKSYTTSDCQLIGMAHKPKTCYIGGALHVVVLHYIYPRFIQLLHAIEHRLIIVETYLANTLPRHYNPSPNGFGKD